ESAGSSEFRILSCVAGRIHRAVPILLVGSSLLRDGSQANRGGIPNFAGDGRSLGEPREDRSPRRIGRCGEDEAQRVAPFRFFHSLIVGLLNDSEVRRNDNGRASLFFLILGGLRRRGKGR